MDSDNQIQDEKNGNDPNGKDNLFRQNLVV